MRTVEPGEDCTFAVVVETRQLAVSGTSHSEENIDDIGLVRHAVNVVKNTGQIHVSSSGLEKPVELAREQGFVEIFLGTT